MIVAADGINSTNSNTMITNTQHSGPNPPDPPPTDHTWQQNIAVKGVTLNNNATGNTFGTTPGSGAAIDFEGVQKRDGRRVLYLQL